MIPCLYDYTETEYTTNGIGKLSDAITCVVTEKRNSSYELKMTYPADGIHADELSEGNIILAKPADNKDEQPFRIYQVETSLDGVLEVAARHISYQLNFITVSTLGVLTGDQSMAQTAMDALKENATTDCPFSFETDIESDEAFSVTEPESIRNCLGGIDGSVLDTYGGEYEWDFYTVRLHESRGSDNGIRIVYGKNLIDFKMERSIENTITGVHPYWKDSDTGDIVELSEKIIELEDPAIGFTKIIALDCSEQFEEEPTEDQLRSYAQSYLASTDYAEPDIDIDIDFLQLWQTPGYEDIAEAERVSLCDTVHVYITKLGIEVSARVTETEYDSLLERYNSITLSNCVTSSRSSSLVTSLITAAQAKAMITLTESAIKLSVAKTYVSNETLEENYSTTVQTKALIEASAEAVTLSFTETLSSYSTTKEIESMIQVSADNITLSVSTTLNDYTKTSEIRSKFAMDSTSITVESGVITFSSNSISIDSDNFQLSTSGKVTASGSFTTGDDDDQKMVMSSGTIKGYYEGEQVGKITMDVIHKWTIDGEDYTYHGMKIKSEDIKLDGTLIDFNADYLNVNYATSSYFYGSTGKLTVITDIEDNGDGTITWTWQTIRFQKGLMVTSL